MYVCKVRKLGRDTNTYVQSAALVVAEGPPTQNIQDVEVNVLDRDYFYFKTAEIRLLQPKLISD